MRNITYNLLPPISTLNKAVFIGTGKDVEHEKENEEDNIEVKEIIKKHKKPYQSRIPLPIRLHTIKGSHSFPNNILSNRQLGGKLSIHTVLYCLLKLKWNISAVSLYLTI